MKKFIYVFVGGILVAMIVVAARALDSHEEVSAEEVSAQYKALVLADKNIITPGANEFVEISSDGSISFENPKFVLTGSFDASIDDDYFAYYDQRIISWIIEGNLFAIDRKNAAHFYEASILISEHYDNESPWQKTLLKASREKRSVKIVGKFTRGFVGSDDLSMAIYFLPQSVEIINDQLKGIQFKSF